MNNLENLLSRLDKVQRIGNGKYKAICPSHDDRTPSLAIRDDDGKLLIHCFGGCETHDVVSAIGLTFADLMPEKVDGNYKRVKKPFYAMDVLGIIKAEAMLAYMYANDMAKGGVLSMPDRERLLLAASRINHGYRVAKNGI